MKKWLTVITFVALVSFAAVLMIGAKTPVPSLSVEHTSGAIAGYPDTTTRPPDSVQDGGTEKSGVVYGGNAWGGLTVGYAGKYKQVTDSSMVYIPRLGKSTFGLIETNVTVKRYGNEGNVVQTFTGKALTFSDTRDTADAGYIMVSPSEAQLWVTVLNGNPGYVFNGSLSNVYSYKITDSFGKEYVAYNLSEIAVACGGAGDPPAGDGLTKINDELYYKRDGFKATPMPTGDIGVGNGNVLAAKQFLVSAPAKKAAATSAPKVTYLDESGKRLNGGLVLTFANFGEDGKMRPMVLSPTDKKVYAVKKLDQEATTITVGGEIGQVTKVETESGKVYVTWNSTELFPELNGKELVLTFRQEIPAK